MGPTGAGSHLSNAEGSPGAPRRADARKRNLPPLIALGPRQTRQSYSTLFSFTSPACRARIVDVRFARSLLACTTAATAPVEIPTATWQCPICDAVWAPPRPAAFDSFDSLPLLSPENHSMNKLAAQTLGFRSEQPLVQLAGCAHHLADLASSANGLLDCDAVPTVEVCAALPRL